MPYPERISIYKDDKCELVMVKWKAGDVIPEHFHPGVNCYFSVLNGQIKEIRCGNGDAILKHSANESAYIDDCCGPHCVVATSDSTTIHFYIKTDLVSRL